MSASEAFPVPRIISVGDSALGDDLDNDQDDDESDTIILITHLAALDALCGKLLLVALGAVDVVLLGDKTLGADGILAGAADEALLVPLSCLVLHLLHPGLEHITTSITPSRELCIVAGSAVDAISLASLCSEICFNNQILLSPWIRTVCPRDWFCTCCRGSKPRASASPCNSDPWSRYQ